VPLALVIVYLVLYGSEAGFQALPDPLVRLLVSQFTRAGLLISALLLGLAVASGFAEPRLERRQTGAATSARSSARRALSSEIAIASRTSVAPTH
jgi:hypothetical protein